MKGPEDLEITWGGTATFACHVEGDPKPSIKWMHNHDEMKIVDDRVNIMEDGSLMIKNSQEYDNGLYECMATSSEGLTKSRAARMTVIKLPVDQNDEGNKFPNNFRG